MKRMLLGGLGLLLLAGCSQHLPISTPTAPLPERVFQGTPAEMRITWDLAGIWDVSRFGTKENPGKLGRWEAKWVLKEMHVSINNEMCFEDENGEGEVYLQRVESPQRWDRTETSAPPLWKGDMLIWVKRDDTARYFSINEQSFGFLMMTGDDGEQYTAVRSD